MNIAVIFAGGVGRRMKTTGRPKQFLELFGKPVIVHTIQNFEYHPSIDKIVVVMLEEYIPLMKQLKDEYHLSKVCSIVPGGKTGQESIYRGLLEAKNVSMGENAIVLIHDGVRPILEEGLIEQNIESVLAYGSAISSVLSKETIVHVSDHGQIDGTMDRQKAWIARAPQSFYLDDILAAHEQALRDGETNVVDSCTMMLRYGKQLHVVKTQPENIKITTPGDYFVAQAIMQHQNDLTVLGVDNDEYKKILER